MIRIFLSLLVILAVASGHAQGLSSGTKALRGLGRVSITSGQVMRQIEQQSRRAEQAARETAAYGKLKIKPSGSRILPVPILDKDDEKRKSGSPITIVTPVYPKIAKIQPIPKIKSLGELLDEKIAQAYDKIQKLVLEDSFDHAPLTLLSYADYAQRHDDRDFAILCLEHIPAEKITPQLLNYATRRYPALSEFIPEMSRFVTMQAYTQMIGAKIHGSDADSARMPHGDTLLFITNKFNPSLNPLVVLSCYYNPSKEVERYKEAADSVIATYDQWSDAFKDTFARDILITLMESGEPAAALDYFGREPLKRYPDSQVDFALDMATCAISMYNDTLFSCHLGQALELDSVATENYWVQLYNVIGELFTSNPSQTELADWLIENHNTPADCALELSVLLLEKFWPDTEFSWEWETIADYTPEQATIRKAILHILNKGESVDEGRSNLNNEPYILFLKAELMMANPLMTPIALSLLDNVASTSNPDLRCRANIGKAYIAAHGLDKPKEGLKILKKNIKLLDDPAVNSEIRDMWCDYMAALATRLGKTKDADKHLKLKESTK